MEFTALAPWKLIVLMAAGRLFSLAGLWLIFKPKTDGHSMVIHVAGMKLEASSAGVLVFLIGTAFFATPLFVQEREQDMAVVHTLAQEGKGLGGATGNSGFSTVNTVSITRDGAESEPNDSLVSANVVPLGANGSGKVDLHTNDFFRINIPASLSGRLFITTTDEGERHQFQMTLYDSVGAVVGRHSALMSFFKNFPMRNCPDDVRH